MVGVELVADRASRTPFAREHQATERVLAAARDAGLLLYSSTGHVDGDGDLVMLGPPFVITDDECELIVERTAAAIATLRTA
jgi:adenosylmethionine-8-amino-7-oxononanoate aminotransferase